MAVHRVTVVIEEDVDGFYAFCPELQGCYAQGRSYEEALGYIRDAVRLHIEERLEAGEKIPVSESISLTFLEVAV
jgi:predicted RNase H-like HicB family nuclease